MKIGNTRQASGDFFWILLIIVCGLCIYAYSLNNAFLGDDNEYITQNPLIFSISGLIKSWDMSAGTPHPFPLTLSAFWIEHKLWGFNPWGYHTFSLTLHLLNALLLFGLLRKLAPPLAGITALLFTVHPIQVETVAWIAEQKNLLCLFFFLLAFHAFLDFDTSRKKSFYLKVLLFFAAALLSKCIAICFATIPLLYAWWKQGSISKRNLVEALPLFIVGAFSVFIPMDNESMDGPNVKLFMLEKILLAGKTFFFYIKQIVFPWKFLTLYPKWDIHTARIENWLFPLAVVFLYAVLYRHRERIGRGPFALLCFYGVSIFPALGFFELAANKATYATDHFSYLSVPSILLLCCAAIHTLLRWTHHPLTPKSIRISSFFKNSMAVAATLYLSLLSFSLTLNYANPFTLWTRLLHQNPCSFGYNQLGVLMLDNPGFFKTEAAALILKTAVASDPSNSEAYVNLGLCYERMHDYDAAISVYGRALRQAPPHSRSEIYYFIGYASYLKNDLDKALDYFQKAADSHIFLTTHGIKRRLENIYYKKWVYGNIGVIYLQKKEYRKAAEAYRKAVTLYPQDALHFKGLGIASWNLGDTQSALNAYQKAHELAPQDKILEEDLGKILKTVASLKTMNP